MITWVGGASVPEAILTGTLQMGLTEQGTPLMDPGQGLWHELAKDKIWYSGHGIQKMVCGTEYPGVACDMKHDPNVRDVGCSTGTCIR